MRYNIFMMESDREAWESNTNFEKFSSYMSETHKEEWEKETKFGRYDKFKRQEEMDRKWLSQQESREGIRESIGRRSENNKIHDMSIDSINPRHVD